MDNSDKRSIDLGGSKIVYSLKTSGRARRLRVTVKPGGKMLVTKPVFLDEVAVDDFLRQKSGWITKHIKRAATMPLALSPRERKIEFAKHKSAAMARVRGIISRLNGQYGFAVKSVSIRDQRTRWGSCSSKGALNFNYRVALVPGHLADYVVAHELCHLREMNHSKRFWDLVAQTVPGHQQARKELRKFFS